MTPGHGGRARGDDGFATTTFVVLFPVLFVAVLVVVQLAVWGHYQHVTVAAAQDAAAEFAAARAGTAAEVAATLADLGGGNLTGVSISVGGGDPISVTIDADVPAILPFFRLPVHANATAAVEEFRP